MANIYVDSHAAGTATGASWVNACTTLAAGITASAAGDDIWVRSNHAETQGSAITLTFKGTSTSPNRVMCATNANSPPTSADLATTATVTTTGAFGITITGSAYVYGVTFNVGTGTSSANSTIGSIVSELTFDGCFIKHLTTTANSICNIGSANAATGKVKLLNTPIWFNGGTSSGISLLGGQFNWLNTASAVGGTQAALLALFINTSSRFALALIDGCDLTGIASGKTLVSAQAGSSVFQFVNCKTTSGVVVSPATAFPGGTVDFIVSDSGATGYRQERYGFKGSLTTETVIINTATDGTTPISWKVATNANANRVSPFETLSLVQWVDTTGGSLTATIQCVTDTNTDATALTNADIWVDAQVLDNSSFPLSTLYTSAPATQLTAGSTLTAGTWATTTGMTTPDKRKMTVTFTPGFKGLVRFTVKVARASLTTLRIDPKVVIA